MNLADLLKRAAQSSPAKIALYFDDSAIDYGSLDSAADAMADGLQRRGIAPQARVAIAAANRPEFVSSYFGILRAGMVAVPLNVMLTEPEVRRILDDAGVSAVIASGEGGVIAERALPPGAASIQADNVTDIEEGRTQIVETDPDDLAVLAYTSGTTGAPRGAKLTHANLLANLEQQMAVEGERLSGDDIVLMALPLFHIFGLNVTLGLTVMNAATGVLIERFEPLDALRAIERHKVTAVFGAPPMYVAWASMPDAHRFDLSHVRMAISGAAPLPLEVLEKFRELFGIPIYEGYGLSETAPVVASNRVGDEIRPGSIGRPLPGVEVRIIDELGHDVETGDPGEIVVRGPSVFSGYWQRDDDSAAAFVDGWFRTGDVGMSDEDGYLFLVDRKRDLIIVSGFNVFPSEVETALMDNPGVAEAAVIGVPHQYSGEAVKAFVVLEPGVKMTSQELRTDVATRLARFKCPEGIEIVDSLPHLVTGKVLRRALRE